MACGASFKLFVAQVQPLGGLIPPRGIIVLTLGFVAIGAWFANRQNS
jgi:hypothetical protein